ncbi:energy transducer TonB [Aureibaculum sp. 2210JD6-5]|uniref:energy transducer TonB n=1 Tax=Aureibaculum sp. 2210JD6-5 TaxID=3103957 RepID=UPI002AAE9745|nr:energy transducer TonB [Aureibaculum sp. 2210JD6-5]MDY7394587.1 energy transducer TonB [Aureibaculum sp. 2210JD6-5]
MEVKKNPKAKLENYSGLFLQLGLTLSLIIVYFSLQHKAYERTVSDFTGIIVEEQIVEDIPITERVEQIKPPPPPPPAPEVIEVVTDEAEVEETMLESTEIDQDDAVEVVELDEVKEVVEEEVVVDDVPFAVIEDAPIFPGCKGNKAELKKCLSEKILAHVGKNFDTNLTQELGLEAGKKRVIVLFSIDRNGNIAKVQARGPHARLEKEAIRVVQSLPKMIPAKQRGVPVGIKYTLPITLEVRI